MRLFDRNAKFAFVVLAITLVGLRVGFRFAVESTNAYLEKQPVELRAQLTTIPLRLGNWRSEGEGAPLTAEIIEELGTDQYIDRRYVLSDADGGGLQLMLHITYYTGLIDAVPHVPDRCLVAGGLVPKARPKNLPLNIDDSQWVFSSEHLNKGRPYPVVIHYDRVTGKPVRVRMPIGDFQLRTTEFGSEENQRLRVYAGYFFIANGETMPNPLDVRKFAFDLTSRYAYYAKVQFLLAGSSDLDQDDFVEIVSGVLPDLLPELMRCLPDWATVESSEDDTEESESA